MTQVQIIISNGRAKTAAKDPGRRQGFIRKILPSLADILSAYGDQMKDYQKHGIPITDEDIEEIMKL